jgi:hypothetical protein
MCTCYGDIGIQTALSSTFALATSTSFAAETSRQLIGGPVRAPHAAYNLAARLWVVEPLTIKWPNQVW